jgi:hypothetical protein
MQCTSSTNKNASIALSDSTNIDTVENITYLLPSPNEILNDIFEHNVKLNPNFVNPISNSNKNIYEKSQAINLGVYIADFAYLNLNKNKTNASDYFKIIKRLTEKLNIYGLIEKSFFDRVNNNLMNNDSLSIILKEMYYNISDILEDSGRQRVYAFISTGTIIETLYLSVMNIDKYSEYQSMATDIFKEKQVFNSYYSFVSSFNNDDDIKNVLKQLIKLKSILDFSVTNTSKTIIDKDKKGNIVIYGGEKIIVNEKIFSDFKENVIAIRSNFINISNN